MKKHIKKIWKEINYEAIIFIYLYIRMIIVLPGRFTPFNESFYALNYSYGFIRRGFIGTIFNIIFNGNVVNVNAHHFVLFFNLLLIVLVSILFGKIIRAFKDKKVIISIITLYLFMPFCVSYLFHKQNFGRQDLYLYIITITQILLIFKNPSLIKYIFVAILSFIQIAIHEGYAMYVFPILFIILVYQIYKSNFNKKLIVGLGIILIVVFIATVYFNFFAQINISNIDELFSKVDSSTDIIIREDVLEYGYIKRDIVNNIEYWMLR